MPLVCCKCTNCGANLEVDKSLEAAVCPFCNTAYIVEKAIYNYSIGTVNIIGGATTEFLIREGILERYIGISPKVTIPKEVSRIGKQAFIGMSSILSVVFQNGPEFIDKDAFKDCKNLSEVVLSDSIRAIGSGAFKNCTNIKEITIPSNVTNVGYGAFENCTNLSKVVFSPEKLIPRPQGNSFSLRALKDTLVSNIDGQYCNIDIAAFSNCTGLKELVLSQNIRNILHSSFENCSNLIKVEFPENVFSIHQAAFQNCSSLKSIVFKNNDRFQIANQAFENCINLETITLPENAKIEIFNNSFANCKKLTCVDIPKNTVFMETTAFVGCDNLKDVRVASGFVKKSNFMKNFKGTPYYNANKKGFWL